MGDDTDQDDVPLSRVNPLSPERARRKQRLTSLATGLGAIFLAFLFVGDRMLGRRSKVEDVYNRGVELRRQGKLDEAIAEYRAAIKLRPSFAEAHNNLGEALHLQGKYEEAIAAFRDTIRVKADHANAHYNLAISLVAQERLDEALGEFREAIRKKPDHGRAYLGLGAVLEARRKPEEALAVYREAARQKPDDAYVQNALAKALVVSAKRPPRDYSEALEHARTAAAIAPKIGFAYDCGLSGKTMCITGSATATRLPANGGNT